MIYADDHEKDITQDDMSTKKMTINEAATIKEVAQGKKHAHGLWIAGEKWNITKQEKLELGDEECHVSMGQGLISKKAVLAFAEYLLSEGY